MLEFGFFFIENISQNRMFVLQAVVNVYRTVVKGNLNRNWFRIKKVIGHTRFKGVKFLKHNAHRPKEKKI